MTGDATFGFFSRYTQGATKPTGNTMFRFQAGDLRFQSKAFDWLVVAGTKAKFKGTGTINGAGNFGFLISAIDGGDDDKFRIKIWNKDDGDKVVYDNQVGAEDDADPSTSILQGQITVQKE
ncbi:MAG: hypothetical protein ACYTHK_00545 [Planctomycetota bacterium]